MPRPSRCSRSGCPDSGNHSSLNQNVYRSSCASQKIGIETPMIAKIDRGSVGDGSSSDAGQDADRDAEGQPQHGGADREGPGDGDAPGEFLPHGNEPVVRVVDLFVEPEAIRAPRGVTSQHEHRIDTGHGMNPFKKRQYWT